MDGTKNIINALESIYETNINATLSIAVGMGAKDIIVQLISKISGNILILCKLHLQVDDIKNDFEKRHIENVTVLTADEYFSLSYGDEERFVFTVFYYLSDYELGKIQALYKEKKHTLSTLSINSFNFARRESVGVIQKKKDNIISYSQIKPAQCVVIGHDGVIDSSFVDMLPLKNQQKVKQWVVSLYENQSDDLVYTLPSDVYESEMIQSLLHGNGEDWIGEPSSAQMKTLTKKQEQAQILGKMLLFQAQKDREYYKTISKQEKSIRNLQTDKIIYEKVIYNIGLSEEVLTSIFSEIDRIKADYYDLIYDSQNNTNEAMLEELQLDICEVISSYRINIPREEYERELMANIAENVWERLESHSKDYLVTALFTYKSMCRVASFESLDYSGVCLLLTIVVDIEMHKRFKNLYEEYLNNNNVSRDEWPRPLKNNDERFTLGSIRFTIESEQSEINEMTIDFAHNVLYGYSIDRDLVRSKLSGIINTVEHIRTQYRNPAAHRGRMDYISAKECFDYILLISKKINLLLEDMII